MRVLWIVGGLASPAPPPPACTVANPTLGPGLTVERWHVDATTVRRLLRVVIALSAR